jgi:hypothetical protein
VMWLEAIDSQGLELQFEACQASLPMPSVKS